MRIILSLMTGSIVAALLFVLMNAMISTEKAPSIEEESNPLEPYRHQPRDERVETRERRMPESPETRRPPPTDRPAASPVEPPQPLVETPEINIVDGLVGGLRIGMANQTDTRQYGTGRAEALVRIEPQIPRRAAIQGIEGFVRVRFTIRADGSVTNARVVESRPGRVFDRAALKAIERWRFRPRMVDGRPVERQATQKFELQLEEGNGH